MATVTVEELIAAALLRRPGINGPVPAMLRQVIDMILVRLATEADARDLPMGIARLLASVVAQLEQPGDEAPTVH
jgi:hypothetical protein